MYAVVRTGGKQVRVSPGDVIKVEKLSLEPHPVFGHRGRQIIDSLVADRWAERG